MIAILKKLMAIFLGICVQVLYADFPPFGQPWL